MQNRRIVRVGLPIQRGLSEKDEDGEYQGYTIDYLNQLLKYIDWEIVYTEVPGSPREQTTALLEMLEKGEIDILSAANYTDMLSDPFLYPSYSYGTAYTTIAVKEDSTQWMEDDCQNWNHIRIAVCPGMERQQSSFEKFAEVSGFTYIYQDYRSYGEAVNAVLDGESDAILQLDLSMSEGLKSIARFSPSPYYFLVNKDRPDLLKDLNTGMYSLVQAYPNLQTELYHRYFTSQGHFYISEEDKQWLSQLKPLRVLFFDGNLPIQTGHNGRGGGLALNYFNRLSLDTGLKYEIVEAKNYADGLRSIESGAVDLVAALPANSDLPARAGLRLSLPYFESNAALVSSSRQKDSEKNEPQLLSANVEEELSNLLNHPQNASMLDSYCVDYYIRRKRLYNELDVDWKSNERILYSVGFTNHVDDRLIAVINSFSKSLTEDDKQQMLYLGSIENTPYTPRELLHIYKYPLSFLGTVLFFSACLYYISRKNRNLRQNATEVSRLYQFSQMINECLFEYDYRRDELIIQNNSIVFPDKHIVEHFLSDMSDYAFMNFDERKLILLIQDMIQNKKRSGELSLTVRDTEIWYKINIVYIDDLCAVGRISDDSKDIIERHELEKKASTDPLTGLENRSGLEDYIENYISKGHKYGVYLLMDLDNFKNVNDMRGHKQGDILLQKFANALVNAFRTTDLKARLGGDEFVVFISNQVPEAVLEEKIRDFIKVVNETVFLDYQDCHVSVSIGAAYISARANSSDTLYREADGAMYVAKYGGKNDFFISDSTICMRRECVNCKESCKKKSYFEQKKKQNHPLGNITQE